jgi:hypothetical protein
MKNILIVIALAFAASNGFAQLIQSSSAITLSPISTATRILQSALITSQLPFFLTSLSSVQARGVAGKEQLKDELVALDRDIISGAVKKIEDVCQPALKELFADIADDEEQMESINSVVKSGSKLHRIATALTVSLLAE